MKAIRDEMPQMSHQFQFSAGHRLDDFEIQAPLYAGALAEVYRAVDTLTGEAVAVKVPSADIINHPLVFYHYQNEMHILSSLSHPHIVRAVNRHRTAAYSVFEYVCGIDLRQHIRHQGPLAIDKALDYTLQTARGLSYLHDCGIIHLDIKPENILINALDRIKIVDFGLARRLGAPDLLYEDFVRPHGTPDYVAPEQLAHHRDDPRTDLYSLALVFYEMLTGRLPHEKGQKFSQVYRRMKKDPIPPRRLREEMPPAMEAAILKALSLDPQARYPSVADFGAALQATALPAASSSFSHALTDGSLPEVTQCPLPAFNMVQSGILAAIADDERAEIVAQEALQAAMADGLPVTLLTVVSGDATDDWTRFGDEVRGERLSRRLEQLALKFRHYGIDPSVRIRAGSPAEVIVETAAANGTGLIVLGASRQGLFKRIFGGGVIQPVMKKAPCRVMVVESFKPPRFPADADPENLTPEQIRDIDTCLTALWIGQINWLAVLVQGLLPGALVVRWPSIGPDPVEDWIQRLQVRPGWAPLVASVQTVNAELQQAASHMTSAAWHRDSAQLCRIYLQEALPSICRLRDRLQEIGTEFRSRAGMAPARRTGLLRRPACAIDERHPGGTGPIQQLQTLKDYFDGNPDVPRNHCRIRLEDQQP